MIARWRLKKDLPDVKAGPIIEKYGSCRGISVSYKDEEYGIHSHRVLPEHHPDWFEPMEENTDIEILAEWLATQLRFFGDKFKWENLDPFLKDCLLRCAGEVMYFKVDLQKLRAQQRRQP